MHGVASNFLCCSVFSLHMGLIHLLKAIRAQRHTHDAGALTDIFLSLVYARIRKVGWMSFNRGNEDSSDRKREIRIRIVVIIISLLWFRLELRLSVKKLNFLLVEKLVSQKKKERKKSHYISANSRQNERIFFSLYLVRSASPPGRFRAASGYWVRVCTEKRIFCSFVSQFVVNQTMNTYDIHMAACPGVLSHANSKVWLQHFAFG